MHDNIIGDGTATTASASASNDPNTGAPLQAAEINPCMAINLSLRCQRLHG
jgi:hypothetical protein